MARRFTERRVVDVLVSHLRRNAVVKRECRLYEKRVDVMALVHDDELWAIEAKVADWRRAVRQATVNFIAADRSYIAIHSSYAHRVDRSVLKTLGIGLIVVGTRWGDVTIVDNGKRSQFLNRLTYGRIRQMFR